MIDKKLQTLAYRLKDSSTLRNLVSELNYDFEDKPVNKDNWNDKEKKIVLEAKIIASKNDYKIYYIKTKSDSLKEWKSVSAKIIKENNGLCMICSHNPRGFKWVFSSLSKNYSKSFSETRHVPVDIDPKEEVSKTFLEFLRNIKVGNNSTATSIVSQVSDAFDSFAVAIHDELTVNVFEALKIISEGIIGDKNNNLSLTNETLEEIREPIFILLYRVIFILYAEDRGIFPVDDKIYETKFSVRWIIKEWLLKTTDTKQLAEYEVEKRIKKLFRLVEVGSEELGFDKEEFFMRSYYGRIFDRKINQRLDEWKIPNSYFLEMLSLLTRSNDKNNFFFLDYSALDTRHLGHIYEHLLEFHLKIEGNSIAGLPNSNDRKTSGSYYTPEEIVNYIVKSSIEPKIEEIIEKINKKDEQIEKILSLKILDPAMGSGHFLVGAADYLAKRICEIENKDVIDPETGNIIEISEKQYVKRKRDVVRQCIYGTDLNPLAVDLTKLSLWLETLSSDLPLAFLSAHLKTGNSLIGNEIETLFDKQTALFESDVGNVKFRKNLKKLLSFENFQDDDPVTVKMKVHEYGEITKIGTPYSEVKFALDCTTAKSFDIDVPNIGDYKTKIGEGGLDVYSNPIYEEVKELTKKLKFFHWELEFPLVFYDENGVKKKNPGFDIIIGNPPWEVWKFEEKDFFMQYDKRITKNTRSRELKKIMKEILKNNPSLEDEVIDKKNLMKSSSKYFRDSNKFPNCFEVNQPIIGKKISSDLDLYKIFLERKVQLLRKNGSCGIIIPSSFNTTLGCCGLRQLIFEKTKVNQMIDFDNKYGIFNIHRGKHFLVLNFENAGKTEIIPLASSIKKVEYLDKIQDMSYNLTWKNVKKRSPRSYAIIGITNDYEKSIIEKLYKFPLLGENEEEKWNISFISEIHLKNQSNLYQQSPKTDSPLFRGNMIQQYTARWEKNEDWVLHEPAKEYCTTKAIGRIKTELKKIVTKKNPKAKTILKNIVNRKIEDKEIILDNNFYRIGYRALTKNDNERGLISHIIPKNTICGNSLILSMPTKIELNEIHTLPKNLSDTYKNNYTNKDLCFVEGIFNSFVVDFLVRKKILENLNMFIMYDLPIPRFIETDLFYNEIVNRVATLVCQDKEFYSDLAKELKIEDKILSDKERITIRFEIEALVGKIYGLTYEEFDYVLSTFSREKIEWDFLSLSKNNKTNIKFDDLKEKILSYFEKIS